ncbi:septum site-determining protein MinC [Alkalilimnicola ehrlichii MLHE-1]
MMTVTVLRLLTAQQTDLLDSLAARIAEAPEFFRGLPVLLDPEPLGETVADLDGEALRQALQAHGLVVLGVRPAGDQAVAFAAGAGLPLIEASGRAPAPPKAGPEPEPSPAPAPAPQPTRSMLITQPVRSGQQVYARGGDLIVTSMVSAGAEVLADGHIHIYGALKGRAMAGVQGDTEARIFCARLDPELVSIAGQYRVSEHIGDDERGRNVQIYLEGDSLKVAPL